MYHVGIWKPSYQTNLLFYYIEARKSQMKLLGTFPLFCIINSEINDNKRR